MGIKSEIYENASIRTSEDYRILLKQLDKESVAKASAIIDVLEIGGISVANAKLILRVCEDCIARCTIVKTTEDA